VKCWCPYLWPCFSVWILSVRFRTEVLRLPDSCSCSARSEFRPHWRLQPLQSNAGRMHPFEVAQCRHRRCRQIADERKREAWKWLIFSFADVTVGAISNLLLLRSTELHNMILGPFCQRSSSNKLYWIFSVLLLLFVYFKYIFSAVYRRGASLLSPLWNKQLVSNVTAFLR
jgi:hypothetical protein